MFYEVNFHEDCIPSSPAVTRYAECLPLVPSFFCGSTSLKVPSSANTRNSSVTPCVGWCFASSMSRLTYSAAMTFDSLLRYRGLLALSNPDPTGLFQPDYVRDGDLSTAVIGCSRLRQRQKSQCGHHIRTIHTSQHARPHSVVKPHLPILIMFFKMHVG